MSEIAKTAGQWMVNHLGLAIVIGLFILSCFFKIVKKEIDPLGWVIGWIGKALTKDVRKDVQDLKNETNEKITDLRSDLDGFEERTNASIDEMKTNTSNNCELLKTRLDRIEEANKRSNDMQTIRQIKAHVLDFANSCMNKRKHTKKDFENIIEENTQYEALVKEYHLVNDVYTEDFSFIMKVYHKCQEEGSFLNERDAED